MALCFALGWQGGTVHQVADELKVNSAEIIGADDTRMAIFLRQAQKIFIERIRAGNVRPEPIQKKPPAIPNQEELRRIMFQHGARKIWEMGYDQGWIARDSAGG